MDEFGDIAKRTGVAFHHQLYTLLVRALGDGVITPGSALPTESELMDRFSVSRNTVRRALARLEEEKRIVRRRGSGSYARNNPETGFSPEMLADVLRKFDDARAKTKSHVVRIAEADTPEYVRRLEPGFGERSLLVQRWLSFQGQPFLFSTSHVPQPMAEKIPQQQLEKQSVLLSLDALGIKAASAEQTTTAVLADSVAAKFLRTDVAVPLLSVQRLIRDAANRPLEYQNHIYRPDRYVPRTQLAVQRSRREAGWTEASGERSFAPWL